MTAYITLGKNALDLPDLILLTIIVALLWALFFQWSRNSYWFRV